MKRIEMRSFLAGILAASALASGCSGDEGTDGGGGGGKSDDPEACAGAALDTGGVCRGDDGRFAEASCCTQDVVSTELVFDVTAKSGRADIAVAGSENRSVVLEVGDLAISSVTGDAEDLAFEVDGGKLVVTAQDGAPTDEWAKSDPELTIEYQYAVHPNFDGFMDAPLSDMTFTWPEFCGNLFPCVSAPADGLSYNIELTGVPEGQVAVFPEEVSAEAPSYMPAFSVGAYSYEKLGETSAGTEVGVYFLEGGREEALGATDDLTAAFDFFETTYGAYTFGDKVASVSVDWGDGDFGGMEHHPYWHVGRGSMGNKQVHHHEAAHGWFGNGVRLRCREDFVLSEGVVSYLEARSTEATGGDPTEIWTDFQEKLEKSLASRDFVVFPDGCNEIGSLFEIFTGLPYMKGAFFFRQVEERVGREALDAALGGFYRDRVGTAAGMDDLIGHIEAETSADLQDLREGWLKSTGVPCTLVAGECAH